MKRRKAARPPPSGAEDDDFDIVGPKAKKPQPAKKRESRIDRDLAQAIAESLCDSTFPHSATSDAPSMRCPSPLNEKLQAPSKAKPARSPARRPSAHQSPDPASLAPPAAPKKRTFHFVVHSDWYSASGPARGWGSAVRCGAGRWSWGGGGGKGVGEGAARRIVGWLVAGCPCVKSPQSKCRYQRRHLVSP